MSISDDYGMEPEQTTQEAIAARRRASGHQVAADEHNPHMTSRPQDCNLPVNDYQYCKLSYPPERMQEVVDTAVSRLMQSTQHLTRSELTEIIESVFTAGVTSVVHERHG